MPELPEVETVKNELAPYVIGRRITGVTLNWEGIVKQPSAPEFSNRIIGQKVTGLGRRGKYLFFELDGDGVLFIHLKMSGSLMLNGMDGRFIRAVIHLDDATDVYFRDPRKFGRMWLAADKSEVDRKLGPEPMEDSFTVEVLAQRLKNRKAPIKPVLLDQTVIAGIGNMYADEALFDSKIHPLRPAGSLSGEEIEKLHRAIKKILWAAIENKGASVVNYYRPDGEMGTAHFEFEVAHGRGKTCSRCGSPIQRIAVRNRGTYFCPRCQAG